jgi:hypothetical protein
MTSSTYLTFDEKKAAEAAFQGLPCDPQWSASAREVYDGILGVLLKRCSPSAEMGHDISPISAEERSLLMAMLA